MHIDKLTPIQGQQTSGQLRRGKGIMKTRHNKDEGKIAYKLGDSANTIVMALPGTDINELRAKYLSNRFGYVEQPIVERNRRVEY
jgi:hypothetical protein